jgi:hypothetical protein
MSTGFGVSSLYKRLGVGSLLVAHTPKSVEVSQERPFGSQFWYALCRSIWFVAAQQSSDTGRLIVGMFHKKSNLSRLLPAVGFAFDFGDGTTTISRCDFAAESTELASRLPLWQRLQAALRRGPRTLAELSAELDAKPDTLDKSVRRKTGMFTRVLSQDGIQRIALVERRAS